jgi:hypothetical protein
LGQRIFERKGLCGDDRGGAEGKMILDAGSWLLASRIQLHAILARPVAFAGSFGFVFKEHPVFLFHSLA